MQKLIRGIIQFRNTRRHGYAETFSRLALAQKPDALFIACSDSRVAVNVFASDDPGDLFVVRNVGNLVPPHDHPGSAGTVAAVDFAVQNLRVRDIIVCGHSNCGAMQAHCQGHENLPEGALRTWLEMGATRAAIAGDVNETSRQNVREQRDHLHRYPSVQRAIAERNLRVHCLWFDIRNVDVWYFEDAAADWTVLDAVSGERILANIGN